MTATDLMRNFCTRALIEELRCPYCAGRLIPDADASDQSDDFRYGILRCECGESPVVESIIWLSRRREGIIPQDDPVLHRVLSRLRAGDPDLALQEALLGSSRHWMRRAATMYQRLGSTPPEALMDAARRHIKRSVIDNTDLTFAQAAALLRNRPYADYLHHRFANPSLLAAIPVILLLATVSGEQPARVLDLCGGAGHASFLIHRFFPDTRLILCDADFANMYLARRFLAPRAACICLDSEARLPMLDHSLDAVFCLDAFHYIREKVGLVQELRRTVRHGGLWLFPHLHNALASNPTPGFPLEPRAYQEMFSFLGARLYPEESLLGQFSARQGVDLSEAPAMVERAAALTMLGGDGSLWRNHDQSELYMRALEGFNLNTVCATPSGQIGPVSWPSEDLENECGAIEAYMEASPHVDQSVLERLRRGEIDAADQESIEAMIRNFVLVPMPEKYA